MLEGAKVDGMTIGLVCKEYTDSFIKMNSLQPVTNPIYLNGTSPTPDGLLSYEIFGVGEDRRQRMAYINLGGMMFMNPVASIKLKQYNKLWYDVLYSKAQCVLKDGVLVPDEEKGQTGPNFLYSVWDKLKHPDKVTLITKEVAETFKTFSKNQLFMDNLLVLPAGFRDINTSSSTRISVHEINNSYSKLIAYSSDLTRDDGFGIMNNITAARIQSLLVEIYHELLVKKIKGQPSKYGHHKKYVLSKNIIYTSRNVISAPNLNVEDDGNLIVKFGMTGVPLSQFCGLFFPFMLHWVKNFFDNEFTYGGKYPIRNKDGEISYVKIDNTYDELFIQDAIDRYINDPDSRFDPIPIPYVGEGGKLYYMRHKGRFHKDNTSIDRFMTWTDLLYIAAHDIAQTKSIDVTRYPVTSENSQFATKIAILSTRDTVPVVIGEKVYTHYPVIPDNQESINNAFLDTLIMSNAYLSELGGDYDGDQTGQKSRFTIEANAEAIQQIESKSYYLSIGGRWMRPLAREFFLTLYMLTKNKHTLSDINKSEVKYKI